MNLDYNTYMLNVYIAGAILVIILAILSIIALRRDNKE